jgi:hypothetical protein
MFLVIGRLDLGHCKTHSSPVKCNLVSCTKTLDFSRLRFTQSLTGVYRTSVKKQMDFPSQHHQDRSVLFGLLAALVTAARTVPTQRCEPRYGGNFSDSSVVHGA